MKDIIIHTNPQVERVYNKYPDFVNKQMRKLRQLIIETAKETEEITELEETLKWSEPAYLTKIGSTVRIDWKEKTPEQYAVYFKCTSKLVPSFQHIFPNIFKYEGSRAIVFQLNDKIPEDELKQCIHAALCYHKIKQFPNLGFKKNKKN